MKQDKILRNFKLSMIITSIANLMAATLFIVAFFIVDNIWFLVAAVVVLFGTLVFIYYINGLKDKYMETLSKIEERKRNGES